ncbi:unnamed protein product [Callosobruchus maculatus]|uniref:CLIP domain-containing serine protease n=2 Tax=Callosobruchus maculatus TaxID=64391 RepID=A0A653CVK4_CALMS|nr:unnamed protein product [Callosobruchus maculatus]
MITTMNEIKLICILLVLCLVSLCCRGASEVDSCQTPRNKQGQCKVISACTPLLSILQKRPLRAQDADYLRRSQCGFEGTMPMVCCPLDGIIEPVSTTTARTTHAINNGPTDSPLLPSIDECGTDTQDRIYGGEVAGIDEFPWMALIEYEKDNGGHGFYCGGVLINKRYVLTAAHCLKGKELPKSWKLVGVRLGEYDTDNEIDCVGPPERRTCAPPPQNIPVEERIAHEQYDPYDVNQYNDIALLRLAREVNYTAFVKPVCVPNSQPVQNKSFVSKKLTVAGWGKTETSSESNIKLKLNVPVKSNNECVNTYRQANVALRPSQMCAGGERGRDSCRGDSGGPLMSYEQNGGDQNWYAVGVVSFGPSPCGMENWPGVYTRVGSYMQWIVDKLRA